jgi:hypothetical protein
VLIIHRLSYIIPEEKSEGNLDILKVLSSSTSGILAARKKLELPFEIWHGLVKGIVDVHICS